MPSLANAQADVMPLLNKHTINPAGMTCFDKYEIGALAKFKTRCDQDAADLQVFQAQYTKCMGGEMCDDRFIESKTFYWTTMLSAVIVGFAIGAGSR